MGMDQYVYAKASNGQKVCMHYWRKNYVLNDHLKKLVPDFPADTDSCTWGCDLTGELVAKLEADDDGGLLDDVGDLNHFLWAAARALEEGFTLSYFCSC